MCYQGSIAHKAVNATTADQVQKAIAFASNHNIGVSVKSTGHDFQGRSTDVNSLNIWLHYMKNVTYIEEWNSTCEGVES